MIIKENARYLLFRANGEIWRHVATGTIAELAAGFGVEPSALSKLINEKGNVFGCGKWRLEAVNK